MGRHRRPRAGHAAEPEAAGSPTAWRLAIAAGDVALPATVHAIYAAQLDDLPPTARLAARRGAVAGRRFPFRALDALGRGRTGRGGR